MSDVSLLRSQNAHNFNTPVFLSKQKECDGIFFTPKIKTKLKWYPHTSYLWSLYWFKAKTLLRFLDPLIKLWLLALIE